MLRRLKWVPWLAAWAGWLWLGVGLYYQLPREFETPTCALPVVKFSAWALGFIGDANEVVVLARPERFISTVQVVDAETGVVVRQTEAPPAMQQVQASLAAEDCRRGVLFAKVDPSAGGKARSKGLYLLDLKSMEWRRLSDRVTHAVTLHPRNPWIAFAEAKDLAGLLRGLGVVVLDYQLGKETVVCTLPFAHSPGGRPFFLLDGRLVLTITPPFKSAADPGGKRLEVWTIADPPVLEKRVDRPPTGVFHYYSEAGRVAFMDPPGTPTVDVYDLHAEKFLFSYPPRDQRPEKATPGKNLSPIISKSGRTVLSGDPAVLWSVETGEALWKPSGHEDVWPQDSQEYFLVRENWHQLWDRWWSGLKFQTYAYRSLETGGLIHRTSMRTGIQPTKWNAAGTLAVGTDGNVYRLPLPVNWPLLALCQVVLAAPILLLWTLLRWRSRRRLRKAAAA